MRFALAGNPNSGKTTLFNLLTGSTAHVGNWPGVTVDRKEGTYRNKGVKASDACERIDIVDLPGIYSLSPYTPEEVVARNYILDEMGDGPDLIINIVDATNLERNLYLTTQIMESDIPVVVALNMTDVLHRNGAKIDERALSERLGVPVVAISALHAEGIGELMNRACEVAKKGRKGSSVIEDSPMAEAFGRIVDLFREKGLSHPVFRAVKAIEGDILYTGDNADVARRIEEIKHNIALRPELEGDFEAAVADARYRYITEHYKSAITRPSGKSGRSTSEKIDSVLTNKVLGLPIFFLFMFLVFHLTFAEPLMFTDRFVEDGIPSPGVLLQTWMGNFTDAVTEATAGLLESMGASDWATGLIIDGLFAGVGGVLSFLPQILMLFLFLSIMEDTGYMARAAFLMDRPLRRFGISGKAFLPLLMGFGCSVPAMMGTRTLDDEKERRLTIMLMPFFSCGAKLPIWSMFAAAIFPNNADKAVFAIYFIGIAAAIGAAIVLRGTILKGAASVFIMELPAYHWPKLRNVAANLWEKARGFIVRATTIIAGATIVIWFLSNFDFSFSMVDPNSQESIVGVLGSALVPIFRPLGFASMPDAWKAVVAIVTGLIAKEMVVSTLGVLYNPEVEGDALEDDAAAGALAAALVASFSPAAALSFMTFNLLSVPCMAAVATANAEMRSGKWLWITIGFWLLTAWVGAFIVYHATRLMGF
ncbi:ferrous iron transport protein B [Synergistaceae bacterium OttesenSCG-928-I11]|nr:ferrous iron transport protein B [Synergistaceae bacterium OttesenSCG-928-I11]